jgi:RNA polymerase sigma-B factor
MLRQATTEVGLPATVLARRVRRPVEQVRVRRRRLGLGRPGARRYTAAEDSVLRSEWPAGADVDALARRLGRSADALRLRARQLGLHRPPPRRRWSASEDAIVRDGYASGLSCNEVAAALAPRTPTAVAARARRLGLATYGRRWTAEDDVRLRRILALRSVDHAARLLGRTPEGVRRRARKLGLAAPRQAAAARAGTRWTEDEDELLRLHAAVNPAILATLLGRSDHAVVSKLRRLGLRTGRWRSPHHPSPSNGGLTPGERALVERELRDRGGVRCSRSRAGSGDRSATPSSSSSGAPRQARFSSTEVSTGSKWSPQAIVVTPCRRESGGMVSSQATRRPGLQRERCGPEAIRLADASVSIDERAIRRRDERRLLRLYHSDGDAGAREELVRRFLPLARQLARRYQRRGEPIDDLVQVASLGLLKAIDRFDPARQTALSSFAIPTILGELKRYFRDHGWAVRVPRSLQERIVCVDEVTEALWREHGRPPTPAEVAERAQNTVEQVLEVRQAAGARWAISLDPPANEQDAGAPANSLAIDEPGFARAEDAATAERLMCVLTDHEREILRLRFGEDLYQSEIAERVGVSPTQVGRVLMRCIAALHETAIPHASSRIVGHKEAADT